MTRALVIVHDDANGPAAIARALEARGVAIDVVRTDRGDAIPESLGARAALVVMGGPMAALDDAEHPHLARERLLLRRAVDDGAHVLGVCLGAQLLACALGGSIRRDAAREVGWYDVARTGAPDALFDAMPARFTPFEWHHDAIVAPPGATVLATSAIAPVQAFRAGERAHGVQFHLELDAALVAEWTRDPSEPIHGDARAHVADQERLARTLFGAWADRVT